jgi:hypothetical protein
MVDFKREEGTIDREQTISGPGQPTFSFLVEPVYSSSDPGSCSSPRNRHSRPPVILEIDQLLSAGGGVGDVELHYEFHETEKRKQTATQQQLALAIPSS